MLTPFFYFSRSYGLGLVHSARFFKFKLSSWNLVHLFLITYRPVFVKRGQKETLCQKGTFFIFTYSESVSQGGSAHVIFFVLWGLEKKLPFWNNSFTVEIQSKGPFNSAKTVFLAYLIIYLVENKLKWPFWLNFNSETVVSKGPLWRSFAKLWVKRARNLGQKEKKCPKNNFGKFFLKNGHAIFFGAKNGY